MDATSPGPDRLAAVVDWVRGRATDPRTARKLTEAMADDAALRADVEWAHRLHRAASDLPLHDPPDLLHQRLRQQFRRWSAGQPWPEPPVLELSAAPVFDSRYDRLQVGVRGLGADEGVVHLVWHTDLADLVVQARTVDHDRIRLDGQVLLSHPTSSTVFEATVEGPGFTLVAHDGDDLGRFRTEAPRTATRLCLSNGELTLVAPLRLGDR